MSLYQRRLEAIMEHHDCNAEEAAELMKFEFAHDELPDEDEVDRLIYEVFAWYEACIQYDPKGSRELLSYRL